MNMQGFQIDFNNRMICVIKDGEILSVDHMGQTQKIGYTSQQFDDLLGLANEYKQMCIDAGLIEVEKTPEQVQAELQAMISAQTKMMGDMAAAMTALKNEVEVLKHGCDEPSGNRGANAGGRPKQSKASSKSSLALPEPSPDQTAGD